MNLIRATATIGGLTLVSRILGFTRDFLMARVLGAGFASDAFLVAFRLPNLFRALFAEGAFSATFVPMFSRRIGAAGGDPGPARLFAEQVLAVLLPVLLGLTALMMIAAGPVIWAMTGGFADGSADKLAFTTDLARITFPYLMLISISSLFGGILNSLNRFWVNAAAPILLNACLIVGLTLFRADTPIETARVQAVMVTVSGILQFLWLVAAASSAGMRLHLKLPRFTPEVRDLLRVLAPAALGASATQFNLLISTALAARFLAEGSVSFLYYADRLTQLPLGLIGIAVGTAILPSISRALGEGNTARAIQTQNRAMELALLLTIPATVALVVAAEPLVRGIFQRGAFTAADGTATTAALAALAAGLPAYVLIKVLTPGFYARSDTRTPVRCALAAVAVNLALNLALLWEFAHVGLALSTAIAGWVNAGLLYIILRRRGWFLLDDHLARSFARMVAAAAIMGAGLWALSRVLMPHVTGGGTERALALLAICGAGGVLYFGAAAALGVSALGDLKARLRRRRAG